jgi:hypothetical protein
MSTSYPHGLPTPAPSTEIQAKSLEHSSTVDGTFELPPAAISSSSFTEGSVPDSLESLSPTAKAPKSTAKASTTKRKASNTSGKVVTQEYVLPPPPTRSRKIIQMKPRTMKMDNSPEIANTAKKTQVILAPAPTAKSTVTQNTSAPAAASTPGLSVSAKRKSSSTPAPTTAAGRKMARKTAHSLIERRRRSKMNEEFGVLKDMIPECNGQEMHKLAILQVGSSRTTNLIANFHRQASDICVG